MHRKSCSATSKVMEFPKQNACSAVTIMQRSLVNLQSQGLLRWAKGRSSRLFNGAWESADQPWLAGLVEKKNTVALREGLLLTSGNNTCRCTERACSTVRCFIADMSKWGKCHVWRRSRCSICHYKAHWCWLNFQYITPYVKIAI